MVATIAIVGLGAGQRGVLAARFGFLASRFWLSVTRLALSGSIAAVIQWRTATVSDAQAARAGRRPNRASAQHQRSGRPFQLSRPTICDHVTLLARVFLLEELPPWHSNRLSRLIKTPKLHVGDTGAACALLGLDDGSLWRDRTTFGQLLETFVFQELRRQASWHEDEIRFHHFRDKDAAEVDIVLERGPGRIAGVEVKAAATVTGANFRGLRKLKEAADERFAAGVVLYDGETSASFGEGR